MLNLGLSIIFLFKRWEISQCCLGKCISEMTFGVRSLHSNFYEATFLVSFSVIYRSLGAPPSRGVLSLSLVLDKSLLSKCLRGDRSVSSPLDILLTSRDLRGESPNNGCSCARLVTSTLTLPPFVCARLLYAGLIMQFSCFYLHQ